MLNFFYPLIIFIFGTIVGSFLNCVIYRLAPHQYNGGGFLKGRSYCPLCKHTLSWQDLVPVLSFLFLKGKCRHCQKKISWQYPLVELSTGILFLLIYLINRGPSSVIFNWVVGSFLIIIFIYDLKHYIIPDKIIYPAIIIALIFNYLASVYGSEGGEEIYLFDYQFLSAFGAAAFFLLIVLISRGKWMGVGDIKLAFLMGLILGWPNILVALFSAFFIGAVIGTGLIAAGRKKLSSEVPFGPFLVTGTFLAMLCGEEIIDWYLNLFLLK